MKPLILPLLFLLAALTGFANNQESYHTFRDDQGRTMRAVVVRTGPGEVWIRRDDGQTFRVQLTTFSETDQTFISQWERRTALQAPNALEIAAKRFSDGRQTEATESRRTTVERYGYIVTLTNRTPFDLQNLTIEYRTFARRGGVGETGQNRELERHTGTARISKLAARGEEEFKTGTISLTSIVLRPGWVFGSRDRPNSNQRRINDDLGGVWIRIKEGSEIIAEFSTPSKLKETEPW